MFVVDDLKFHQTSYKKLTLPLKRSNQEVLKRRVVISSPKLPLWVNLIIPTSFIYKALLQGQFCRLKFFFILL